MLDQPPTPRPRLTGAPREVALRLLLDGAAAADAKRAALAADRTFKQTPLHYAAHKGQLEAAEYLLDEGDANQHLKDKAGCTASMIALQEGNGDVCAYLDARNAHVHDKYDQALQ